MCYLSVIIKMWKKAMKRLAWVQSLREVEDIETFYILLYKYIKIHIISIVIK